MMKEPRQTPLEETTLNEELRAANVAMLRAAELARERAIQTNTGIVVAVDGEPVYISAEQLLEKEPA